MTPPSSNPLLLVIYLVKWTCENIALNTSDKIQNVIVTFKVTDSGYGVAAVCSIPLNNQCKMK